MKIALVHYHLRPGGVTQVMLHQARALQEAGEDVLVLSGEVPYYAAEWEGIPVKIVPALHYDRYRSVEGTASGEAPAALARDMEAAIRSFWPGGEAIIHVHNPLIRKNSLLMGALKKLSLAFPLLLQNHDLAEDFRPDVYVAEGTYPENCHYAVINSRDYRFLLDAGLQETGLHLLPNEVRQLTITPGLPKTRYLYPVRGIRRKNIGEVLLLSLFLPPGKTAALTQPPTTEQDAPAYRRWKDLAAALKLPLEFEVGVNVPFADVMGTACAVITTSIKEGFGFSFLEPWTASLAVTGRRIDYVCRDFEEAGLNFDSFYKTLDIPAEYVEPELLRKKIEEALTRVYAAFGSVLPSSVPAALKKTLSGDRFDFGIMDEVLQEGIIRLAAENKAVRDQIKKVNPFLDNLEAWQADPALTEANRSAVLQAYSREKILETLLAVYKKTLTPVIQGISRPRLLELYLDPARLSLIGISPAEQAPKAGSP